MRKILSMFVCMLFLMPLGTGARNKQKMSDREYWCSLAYKMAQPVLENMSKGELQKNMQLEVSPSWDGRNKKVAYMECFGRLMAGISPWLALPDDGSPEGTERHK